MKAFFVEMFGRNFDSYLELIILVVCIVLTVAAELLLWLSRKLFHFPPRMKFLDKLPFDLFELLAAIVAIIIVVGLIVSDFIQ